MKSSTPIFLTLLHPGPQSSVESSALISQDVLASTGMKEKASVVCMMAGDSETPRRRLSVEDLKSGRTLVSTHILSIFPPMFFLHVFVLTGMKEKANALCMMAGEREAIMYTQQIVSG